LFLGWISLCEGGKTGSAGNAEKGIDRGCGVFSGGFACDDTRIYIAKLGVRKCNEKWISRT
jgi:hypothetical protein